MKFYFFLSCATHLLKMLSSPFPGQATLTKMAPETGAVTQHIRTHKVIIKHWPVPGQPGCLGLDLWHSFILFSKRNASVK